nr:4617_t:CDS:2 [Entrophospora candida]
MSTSEMQTVELSNTFNFFNSSNINKYITRLLRNLLNKESDVPTLNITIELPITNNDLEFRKTLVSVIAKNIDGWADIKNENDISIEADQKGLTNNLYFITNLYSKKKIILRIYGQGVDKLLDREKELVFLKMLSRVKIGPQLLLIFNNGRFEQFFESVTLTNKDIRNEEISRKIATYMFKLHNVVTIFPPDNIETIVPEVWSNIDKWFQLSWDIVNSDSFDPSNNIHIKKLDLGLLKTEIEELKSKLQIIGSPIVFSHNDCQCGNILSLTDGSGQLAIIDLEYSGWNNRGFDIGNHLCEWAYDYNSTESHMEHKDCLSRDELLKQLEIEADGYSLTSHIMWALWAIVQNYG